MAALFLYPWIMKKNLILSFVILLLIYGMLESTFLWWFPRVFPSNAQVFIEEGFRPLLQSSKRSFLPHNYIAILGDSYAQGMGDWASAEMNKPMARYHSAHILQDAIGKDVVSFGSAGAGSVRAMVTEPISQLAFIRRYVNKAVEQPEWILVYFYEGNDLYDNASYYHYSFPRLFDEKKQYDAETYQRYLKKFAVERDATWQSAQTSNWRLHLPFANFLDKVVRTLSGMAQAPASVVSGFDDTLDPPWIFGGASYKEPGTINQASINGETIQLPDQLQGPALNLDAEEWQQAWFAFEQAFLFSRQSFPDSHYVLVYIPSVISCYTLASEKVSLQSYERREGVFPASMVQAKSLQMRTALKDFAQKYDLPIIDATNAMREAATHHALHGPGDWNHPNKYGYESLTTALLNQMRPMLVDKEAYNHK